MIKTFRRELLEWFERVRRPLPWRSTNDPYAIWLSEVMLQQTRVATVIPYFDRFLERFPTAAALASAPEEEVLHMWNGLGYYSRARNMLRAAKQMSESVPADYASIRELPGVGDYTAAAVASIAFGLPHAAVDGNVLRVLARITAESGDIREGSTRLRLSAFAGELLDRKRPGDFNQALMELGATVCVPRNPKCLVCPVARHCEARIAGTQHDIPVKSRPERTEAIERTVYLVKRKTCLLFWQRPPESRRLAGFWELPEPEHLPGAIEGELLGRFQHGIVNQTFKFRVVKADAKKFTRSLQWIQPLSIEYLFSTTTRKALAVARRCGYLDS